MSHVTKISGNDIKDKWLRETMNSSLKRSISEINNKIENLRIAIMAIGQVVLGLCDTIEHLSRVNAVKEKYYETFYNNTASIPDNSGYNYYKGALDNLATVLLNLAETNFSDEYRNGGTARGGDPSQRWSNAKTTCIGTNAYNDYYKIGDEESGKINSAISWGDNIMHDIIKKTTGGYSDVTNYSDSNIF